MLHYAALRDRTKARDRHTEHFFSPLNSPILRSSGHLQDMHDHTHIQYSEELINLKIMK